MERLVVMRCEGLVQLADLPESFRTTRSQTPLAVRVPPDGLSFNEVVDGLETDLILQALEQTSWNKNQAARLLGLNRTTLLEKIKRKKLEEPAD